MYLQLVVGIVCVVVAAAAAVYFSMSSPQPPQQYQRRRRTNNYDDENRNGKDLFKLKNKHRDSRPGDKCSICLEVMSSETMRTMHCGHALHELPCYEEYRELCRQCPYCEMFVMRIDLPGDDCAICLKPMEEEDMEYLRCEHALHKYCLHTYKLKKFRECPKCKRSL